MTEGRTDAPADGKDAKQDASADKGRESHPVIVKKYANRRLYNTKTSAYVTLDNLAGMVREGQDFVVVDAKSGDDLTRSVLAQIIFEQESRGETMLPVPFLRRLIGMYGDNMQSFVPSYLEASMDAFAKNQDAMRKSVAGAFGAGAPAGGLPASGMSVFQDAAKQNMAFFEQGLTMFGLKPPSGTGKEGELEALRAEVERLKAELAAKG